VLSKTLRGRALTQSKHRSPSSTRNYASSPKELR
jgi:hypothetical protein